MSDNWQCVYFIGITAIVKRRIADADLDIKYGGSILGWKANNNKNREFKLRIHGGGGEKWEKPVIL